MNHMPQTVIEVPQGFVDADIEHLMNMIADMLGRLIAHNDQIPITHLTRFHSRAPPDISVADYLHRIVKYTSIEKACLLILLIYIDRICERDRTFTITSLTVHRFIIAAVTASSKALCDSYCTNSHYARVGGICIQELNSLEIEFMTLIDWKVICTEDTLQQYYTYLVKQSTRYRSAVPASECDNYDAVMSIEEAETDNNINDLMNHTG